MSTLSVRLPDSLHKKLKETAQKEGVSMNQIVNLSIAEKVSALLTEDYLKTQDKKEAHKNLKEILEKVPDRPPEPYDKL